MTSLNIAHWRLHNQRIALQNCESPAAVVRWLGAMQAQDYLQAVWAVGVRMPSTTMRDIEAAIEAGEILRTWPMRGTIHFVAPEDALWMVQLCASRMIAKDRRRQEQLGLDVATLERCVAVFQQVLAGGRRLTRAGMLAALETTGISTNSQRGYHILWYAAQLGAICLGPMAGKEQTFVLLHDWVPNLRILSRDDSLAELARRYFASHGPATLHDFAWWSGLTMGDVRAGLEAAKPGLIAEKIDGKEYWLSAGLGAVQAPDPARAILLPGYDEYLLGYADRGAILDPQHAEKVCPGGNGVFAPMIVVDGQVVGTWKRTVKKNTVVIARAPFDSLNNARIATFGDAARRYAAFLGLTAVIG